MSENAPNSTEIPAFEEVLSISQDELERVLTDHTSYDFFLGSIKSTRDYANGRQEMVKRVNDCLVCLGLTTRQQIVDSFIESRDEYNFLTKDTLEARLNNGDTAGDILFMTTYADLDIESADVGGSEIRLTFNIGTNLELNLTGSGEFWTERTYRVPEEYDDFPIRNELDISALAEIMGKEPEIINSEIDYEIEIEGMIRQR